MFSFAFWNISQWFSCHTEASPLLALRFCLVVFFTRLVFVYSIIYEFFSALFAVIRQIKGFSTKPNCKHCHPRNAPIFTKEIWLQSVFGWKTRVVFHFIHLFWIHSMDTQRTLILLNFSWNLFWRLLPQLSPNCVAIHQITLLWICVNYAKNEFE